MTRQYCHAVPEVDTTIDDNWHDQGTGPFPSASQLTTDEERHRYYESTPLSWPWVIALAVAWPVVIYELLAADGPQDGR